MTYDSDVEHATESTSMLRRASQDRDKAKPGRFWLWQLLDLFTGGIYAPNASTYAPIEIILNTEDEAEQDRLTERWRDNRLSELSFVGVVSALLAGVLTSTGSWPDIVPGSKISPWPVRTSWYCGIILSIFSILTAADQTVRLHRLSSHRDGCRNIRYLLAKGGRKNISKKTGRLQPNTLQIYTWQMPVMFLTTAVITLIVGMFFHVWSATRHLLHLDFTDPNVKVASTYTIVASISIIIFFVGQFALYTPDIEEVSEE